MSKIVVNISSYRRDDGLKTVINSIINKCDKINVALNSYTGNIPEFLYHNKINILITDNSKGDAFKFFFLDGLEDVFYITLDDDILYPENFIETIIKKCEKYDRKKVITYHGRSFKKFPIGSYYNSSSQRHHFLQKLSNDTKVQFGGTGLMCFHTDLIKIPFSYFKYPNMADVWIGKYCMENNIDIICAEHNQNSFKDLGYKETIYHYGTQNDYIQTMVVNSIFDKTIELDKITEVNNLPSPQTEKKDENIIRVRPTLEKSKKIINYDKVNSIFNVVNQVTLPKTNQNVTHLPKKYKTNSSILNNFKRKKR
jgi:hypothetical protein